jgi:subtilisin family serine protease
MRRPLVALASFGLLASQIAFTGVAVASDPSRFTAAPLTPISTYSTAKSASGAAAKSDPALLGRTDSKRVNIMIKYDLDPVASYAGGVAGFAATSPRVTGKSLKANRSAVAAYKTYASSEVSKISASAKKAASGLDVRSSYTTAYGGVAASVPANQVAALLKAPGVVAVQEDSLEQPLDDNTQFLGATAVWQSLGGSAHAGSNVTIAVLDTGLWPEHPMLSPAGVSAPAGGIKGCEFGDGTDTANLGPTFTCNNKLIGAYSKMATYMAVQGAGAEEFCDNTTKVCSPRDSEGHGTHTTTTAGGDCVSSAVLYGVERGPVCGIAPGAHVEMMRVCGSAGCFSSDSVSAVEQAIEDGADVINFSISGGGQPFTDPVEFAFLAATDAGISVNASAGNSGPGAATSDPGGPWVTTVGASTGPREFRSTLHLTADGGATFDKAGVTLTNGISTPTPVVLAQTLPKAGGGTEDVLCQSPLAAGAATGKIVACQRGTNARVDKGFNVLQGGAAGMILYNPVKQDVETDNHWLPAIHLDGPNTDLLAFINGHTNVQATFDQGTAAPSQPDMMAAFSSRGPLGDWIKPDVTAPGVQVLAGMTPQPTGTVNGPPGNLYQAIAGTSMSSPHAAGVSALVKAAHPSWTPEMIKSALMTSSVQQVVKEDGATPADPFDMGAGRIRADRAVNPTLVFDATTGDFLAAGADPLHRIDLNIASVDAPSFLGSISTTRTALNVSGRNQVLKVTTQAPAGASITVGTNSGNLSVKAGGSITFPITISGSTLTPGQYFGRITLSPQGGGTSVVLPVAFRKVATEAGAVQLTHSCTPTTFGVSASTTCTVSATNTVAAAADVSISVAGSPGLHYSNVSSPATLVKPQFGAKWSGTLTPALAPRVESITPTEGPAGGYLPLSLFGIPATPGVGDDTLTNFNVPTFFYGGEAYTSIGVASNGFLVVGGGTAADATPFFQTFPSPTRPNNVVAPLWTDLNPTAGGVIRVGILSGGGFAWLVVDYDHVKNFSNATTHTYETWIQLASGGAGTGPDSEQITISYDAGNTASGDPGVGGANSGAENRDGSSGVNLTTPADGTEWAVNLGDPIPGGSVSFTYDASADTPGTYRSVASMTSNRTTGTSQAVQTLTVTP